MFKNRRGSLHSLLFALLIIHGCDEPKDPCPSDRGCGTCEKCQDGACVTDPEKLNACGVCPPMLQDRDCNGTCCAEGDRCVQDACCKPATCDDLGHECGEFSDGCDGPLDCGSCGQNQICQAGLCECTAVACNGVCCNLGEVCDSGSCCQPLACSQINKQCGLWPNSCGSDVDCGDCDPNQYCDAEGMCQCSFTECQGNCCQEGQFCRVFDTSCSGFTKLSVLAPEEVNALGASVGISGHYAIVGAYKTNGSSGAAYVFVRSPDGTWSETAKLVAPDAQEKDAFGRQVAIHGDYAIVGAYQEDFGDDDTLSNAGAAYIFHRQDDNTWDMGTKLVAPDPETEDRFGGSVSIHGDYAVIGAYSKNGEAGYGQGAAYVFRRTGENTWDSGTKLLALDAQGQDNFGSGVGIYDDTVVVGAEMADDAANSLSNTGAAYIFRRIGENTWDTGKRIMATDPQPEAYFGISVAIDQDYVIVGANKHDSDEQGGLFDAGAAYIYQHTDENIWEGTKIVSPEIATGNRFGGSVSIRGPFAVVGAIGKNVHTGAAYVYQRIADNVWDSGLGIAPDDLPQSVIYGSSVSTDGKQAIIGAMYYESTGTAFVY